MRTRLFSLILALFAVLLPSAAWAQETAYVVLSVNETGKTFENSTDADITYTLTFKYDANRPTDAETGEYLTVNVTNTEKYFNLNTGGYVPSWVGYTNGGQNDPATVRNNFLYSPKITQAILTDEFVNTQHPTSCAYWFAHCVKLTNIQNIEKLQTDKCDHFSSMFLDCIAIESLDLNNWNTSKARFMDRVFRECRNHF